MNEEKDKAVEPKKEETTNTTNVNQAQVENKGKAILSSSFRNAFKSSSSSSSSHSLRKKLFLLAGVIVGVVVILLIVMAILSSLRGKNLSYDELETQLKNAAIKFYQVQDSLLPQQDGETSEVDADTLASDEYKFMKPLSELHPGEECTGRVVVEKVGEEYVYTPYLNCGENYSSRELYQAVLETGIDSKGNGLYEMNGEHVFRGEYVNNYVQLDQAVYRIVKVMNDNKMLLILGGTDTSTFSVDWDNRYNSERRYDSGINNYRLSRMADYLKTLYQTGYEDNIILSDNDKEKLVPFNLCLGKRGEADTDNTNTIECSDVLADQMIGLLTVSDYINAFLDSNCQKSGDQACKNYNYLVTDKAWWLITASSLNTSEVFFVNQSGYVDSSIASNYRRMRPVVMLNSSVMVRSGTGTISDPYILK